MGVLLAIKLLIGLQTIVLLMELWVVVVGEAALKFVGSRR
jgi:hypothetical protein